MVIKKLSEKKVNEHSVLKSEYQAWATDSEKLRKTRQEQVQQAGKQIVVLKLKIGFLISLY
jgi:hypothetical protein